MPERTPVCDVGCTFRVLPRSQGFFGAVLRVLKSNEEMQCKHHERYRDWWSCAREGVRSSWRSSRRRSVESTDSLPFRKGQWGAEFAGSEYASVGVLRFISPRRAFVFDVGGGLGRWDRSRQYTSRDSLVFAEPDVNSQSGSRSLRVRLGHRWYRSVHPRIAQFATAGAFSSHSHTTEKQATVPTPQRPARSSAQSFTRGWGAGVFGGVGASWLLTSQLALGASWEANGGYTRSTTESSQSGISGLRNTGSGYQFSFGSAALRLNLFF